MSGQRHHPRGQKAGLMAFIRKGDALDVQPTVRLLLAQMADMERQRTAAGGRWPVIP